MCLNPFLPKNILKPPYLTSLKSLMPLYWPWHPSFLSALLFVLRLSLIVRSCPSLACTAVLDNPRTTKCMSRGLLAPTKYILGSLIRLFSSVCFHASTTSCCPLPCGPSCVELPCICLCYLGSCKARRHCPCGISCRDHDPLFPPEEHVRIAVCSFEMIRAKGYYASEILPLRLVLAVAHGYAHMPWHIRATIVIVLHFR